MSLIHYEVDFSQLNPDDKAFAEKMIDSVAFNSLFYDQGFNRAEFFIEKDLDISSLDLPAGCHLRQIP